MKHIYLLELEIWKKGDQQVCYNYREITLLSIYYKILSQRRFKTILTTQNKTGQYQGFCSTRKIYCRCHNCCTQIKTSKRKSVQVRYQDRYTIFRFSTSVYFHQTAKTENGIEKYRCARKTEKVDNDDVNKKFEQRQREVKQRSLK